MKKKIYSSLVKLFGMSCFFIYFVFLLVCLGEACEQNLQGVQKESLLAYYFLSNLKQYSTVLTSLLGSISTRCSGKEPGLERAAEIEPKSLHVFF